VPRKDWLATLGRLLPFAVPFAYLALVLWIQPGEHVGLPREPAWLGRLLYDEGDVAAMALRGINAHLGRTAGNLTTPGSVSEEEYRAGLKDRHRPYQATYYLEYPHACLLLFRLGYVWQTDVLPPPASVCDGAYHNVSNHEPEDDYDRRLWRQFRLATQTYLLVFLACQLAFMFVLAKGYDPEEKSGLVWLCVLPAALYFTLHRFDIVPALLTALSLLALGRERFLVSAALLAAATAIKVYPIVLAPLLVSFLWDRRESAARWVAGYAATLALFFAPVVIFSGWEAFWGPYHVQLNREPMGPTLYGVVFPASWSGNEPAAKLFRLGLVLLTTAALLWRRIDSLDALLRRGAIALIVFVSMPVFYSPQWVLWLLPLLVPLASRQRWLVLPLVAIDLLTYLSFPIAWESSLEKYLGWPPLDGVVMARFVVLAVVLVMLAWPERRVWFSARAEPTAQPLAM
jgi:hypothetical protein